VLARVPLQAPVHTQNADYLYTKASRMHHLLDLDRLADNLPPAGGASQP
jgi:hypothetical protein